MRFVAEVVAAGASIVVVHPRMTVEELYMAAVSEQRPDDVFRGIPRRLTAALAAFQAVITALEPLRCHWAAIDRIIAAEAAPSRVVPFRRPH
jgi:hypothetical protein